MRKIMPIGGTDTVRGVADAGIHEHRPMYGEPYPPKCLAETARWRADILTAENLRESCLRIDRLARSVLEYAEFPGLLFKGSDHPVDRFPFEAEIGMSRRRFDVLMGSRHWNAPLLPRVVGELRRLHAEFEREEKILSNHVERRLAVLERAFDEREWEGSFLISRVAHLEDVASREETSPIYKMFIRNFVDRELTTPDNIGYRLVLADLTLRCALNDSYLDAWYRKRVVFIRNEVRGALREAKRMFAGGDAARARPLFLTAQWKFEFSDEQYRHARVTDESSSFAFIGAREELVRAYETLAGKRP